MNLTQLNNADTTSHCSKHEQTRSPREKTHHGARENSNSEAHVKLRVHHRPVLHRLVPAPQQSTLDGPSWPTAPACVECVSAFDVLHRSRGSAAHQFQAHRHCVAILPFAHSFTDGPPWQHLLPWPCRPGCRRVHEILLRPEEFRAATRHAFFKGRHQRNCDRNNTCPCTGFSCRCTTCNMRRVASNIVHKREQTRHHTWTTFN